MRGAEICTRTEVTAITRGKDDWQITLTGQDGKAREIKSRILINAAGPWVEEVAHMAGHYSNSAGVRLVKGSHIVTQQLWQGEHGYIFQSADGRVIFAMPYEGKYTLIGTTDVDWDLSQGKVTISDAEVDYLCSAANEYLAKEISPSDVVWTYAGLRPLYDDKAATASVATRDYVFDLSGDGKDVAVMLAIYGGKLTTFRKLAEHAMEKLKHSIPNMAPRWTHDAALPGGEFSSAERDEMLSALQNDYAWMDREVSERLFRSYGIITRDILGDAKTPADLGQDFGGGLYEAELRHLVQNEFAMTAEDILYRRSKLGLHLPKTVSAKIETWLSNNSAR